MALAVPAFVGYYAENGKVQLVYIIVAIFYY